MKALILVDIQKDFCKNGALEVKDGDMIVPIANKMIDFFKEKGDMVIGTKDWHPSSHKSFAVNSNGKIGEVGELNGLPQVWWPVHCVQNENGSKFHSELHSIENVIYKGENPEIDSYSAFFDNGKRYKTPLDNILKNNRFYTKFIDKTVGMIVK